jgi:uncharacterized protein YcbK (DUF882 family)
VDAQTHTWPMASGTLSRRRLLMLGVLTMTRGLAPLSALVGAGCSVPSARVTMDAAGSIEKAVGFYHIHTGEQLRMVYWRHGQYLPGALREVDYLLRDYHTNEVKSIDPQVLDLLYAMSKLLETNAPFQVLSGYRSPATNAKLHRHDREVAVHSLHMAGQAVDIRLPGRPLVGVRRAALAIQAGGVGYYPQRNFLHVDTGPVRSW